MRRFRVFVLGNLFLSGLVMFPVWARENTGRKDLPQPQSQLVHLWSQGFGDADWQEGWSVASDPSGNVVMTGYFYGTVDFGGGPLTSAGWWDIFLAKFDSNGNHLWSQGFGDASWQEGRSVAFDPSGNVVMTGYFEGTVDFGGGPLTSEGDWDIFLAKFGLTVGVEEGPNFRLQISDFRLFQNHPNPFRQFSVISYQLREPSFTSLKIYDLSGRLVESLVNEPKESGIYRVQWQAYGIPSGSYFYTLQSRFGQVEEFVQTRKLAIIK